MAADRRAERPRSGGARPPQPRTTSAGRRQQPGSERSGRRSPPGDDQAGRGDKPSSSADRGQPGKTQFRSPQTGSGPVRREPGKGQSRGGREGQGARRPESRPATPDRPAREPARPGLARAENEPALPDNIDTRSLHRAVRAELRSLPKDLGEIVAGHLVLAGQLIDEEPERAYGHAEAARRRAARLPIVREAAAETAYAAGRYDAALSEYRALRRMTGTDDYLPVMADCERALGRPQNALKLAKEAARRPLEPPLRVEMTIVEAGARADLGQLAEARRILEQAQPAERPGAELAPAYARLCYAHADLLLRMDQSATARESFARAAELDTEQQTDAQQRLEELDGLLIEFDDEAE